MIKSSKIKELIDFLVDSATRRQIYPMAEVATHARVSNLNM